MVTPDSKVKKLMTEYLKTNNLRKSAMRADMDRKTARKYVNANKLPSELKKNHATLPLALDCPSRTPE